MYWWSDIYSIGDVSGIYAWYYLPEITTFDLDTIVDRVSNLKKCNRHSDAKAEVEAFLERSIFRYFTEEPYHSELRGRLKPTYSGQLVHRPRPSSSLVERLVSNPMRLYTVRDVLHQSAPLFASPLYIGMSERLGKRLKRHRHLIEKYRQTSPSQVSGTSDTQKDIERDQSFARQVAERGINPQRLFVVIHPIETDDNRYVDLENILNRIHYPLMGRN